MVATPTADPFDAFLSLWTELCALAGRRSLTVTRAIAAGSPELRERLAVALVALGYPEACAGPRALGQSLRRLRERTGSDGRRLGRIAGKGGAGIWYVVPAPVTREVAA